MGGMALKEESVMKNEMLAVSGDRLRELRRERGWTQKDLASILGVSEATMRRYECGQTHIKNHCLDRLEEATGIFRGYWFGVTEAKSREKYLEELAFNEAVDNTTKQLEDAIAEYWSQVTTLFSLCGFRLEIHSGLTESAQRLNMGVGHDVIRQATDIDDPEHRFFFDDADVPEIMAFLKDALGFWAYQKGRKMLRDAKENGK